MANLLNFLYSQHPRMQVSASIKYLEFCVNKLRNSDRAIHNFLISAYAQSSEASTHTKLMQYLLQQSKVSKYCNSVCV